MDLKHFGDSYDIVKRALLGWLADLGSWSAHPMFTHDVSDEEAKAFGDFLGVPLVSRERLTIQSDRKGYFRACQVKRHLFLDPDTGLRLGPPGKDPKYLYGDELKELAKDRQGFLTMTFDQSLSRAREAEDQVREKLTQLELHGFSYVSHVAFIVVGRDPSLVKKARKVLLARSRLPGKRLVSCG